MSQLLAATIEPPTIEYASLSPMLIVFGAAVVGVVIEAFAPRRARYPMQLGTAVVALVGAFAAVVAVGRSGVRHVAAEGALAIDGPTLFLQGTLLGLSLLGVLLVAERGLEADAKTEPGPAAFAAQAAASPGSAAERVATSSGFAQTEVFPLLMFAVGGMLLFPAANDLLTMFVALEVLSLPLYLLCGLARRRRLLSQEAALKYFLLGAFSSAFFLYGVALLYGYAGSVRLDAIADAMRGQTGDDPLLLFGAGLLGVGLLFKIGAVPFHAWTPDVYEGAPTPVTAFMSATTKVAAAGALLRVFYVGLGGLRWEWRPMMWGVAILTMAVGVVFAITQTDVKRMLAYSAILNAGYLLVGVSATSRDGLSSTMFYALGYGFAALGSFAVLTLVRDVGGEATHLSRWAGLGRRSPVLAAVFALFLLAFAGIPLTSGFTAKFAVFSAAVAGGATPLVIIGVVTSAVAAFFYVRVVVLMFFSDPAPDGPVVAAPSALTTGAIAVGAVVTVALGVMPQPVLELAEKAALFVR